MLVESNPNKEAVSFKKNLLISLLLVIIFIAGLLVGYLPSYLSHRKYLKNQFELNQCVQDAIKFYWNGGDIKKAENEIFKGITLRGNLDAVEFFFAKAIELAPQRIDLKYDLASTQILKGEYDKALVTYKDIINSDPYSFNAGILYGVYAKALGQNDIYELELSDLGKSFPENTEKYLKIILTADNIIKSELNIKAEKYPYKNGAIVILGYALDDKGNPRPTLIERLKQGLALFRLNRTFKIIVTGGMARGGITEAFVMKQYLMQNGVPENVILLEDQSKDTVGNAVNSAQILKDNHIENVTIVSSASHIRRALALFNQACIQSGAVINFNNLVYLDYPSIDEASHINNKELSIIYRDLLRTSGIWAYPCIQN